jgi:pilus assembly protein Flp/PilA
VRTPGTTAVATREWGATAVEYGLMLALIAAVVIGGVVALGRHMPGLFVVDFTPAP